MDSHTYIRMDARLDGWTDGERVKRRQSLGPPDEQTERRQRRFALNTLGKEKVGVAFSFRCRTSVVSERTTVRGDHYPTSWRNSRATRLPTVSLG